MCKMVYVIRIVKNKKNDKATEKKDKECYKTVWNEFPVHKLKQ